MRSNPFRCMMFTLAITGIAGIAAAEARVYVRLAPPPVVVEERGVAPDADHVWISGYHHWDGSAYAWTPGHWEARPVGHHRYYEGRWRHSHRGYYWSPGYWR